jgi:integrase
MKTHQDGCVVRRGSKWVIRWRVRTTDGTRKHRAETVEGTKADAKRVLADRVREANGGRIEPAEITFQQFIDNQWKFYTERNWKQGTQRTAGSFVNGHIVPFFGAFKLVDVSPSMIDEFLHKLSKPRNVGTAERPIWKTGLGDKTVANLYGLLVKMFNLAVDRDLITANPTRKVEPPQVERKEKPMLTLQQVRALINATPARYRALITLLALTGLRIGKALALKWSDLDFDNHKLMVKRAIYEGQEQSTKTKASERTKRIGPALLKALETHKELSVYVTPDDYVFANDSGNAFNQNWLRVAVLYPSMQVAGIDRKAARAYGFHLLRHTAGSIVYAKTTDLKKTQKFLGHANAMITSEVYTHLMADADEETVNAVEQAVFAEDQSTQSTQLPSTPTALFSNVRKSQADIN